MTVAVTGPARRSRYDLRVPAQARRFRDVAIRESVLLRLPPGRSPPQGALLDLIGEIRASARARGRLRRAHLAAPPRRARRRDGVSLARRRPPRRDRRIRRSAAGQARAFDGARCSRRAPCGDRRDRPRRGRGPVGRAPHPVSRVGPLPPAGRVGPERRVHRRRRARRSRGSSACPGSSVRSRRWRRSAATCSRSGGSPRSCARVWQERSRRWPGLRRGRRTAGTSCSSERRSCSPGTRTPCSTPGSSSRSPPSLRSSSSSRGSSEASPATRCRARWRRWSPSPAPAGSRPRPILLTPVRRRPALFDPRQRARRAGGRAPARARARHGADRAGRCPRLRLRSPGRTGGSPPTSPAARDSSAACPTPPCRRARRLR